MKINKLLAYLNKDVREVGRDIIDAPKAGAAVVTAGLASMLATLHSDPALADMAAVTAAAQGGLQQAEEGAWDTGAMVVTAIAVLVAIGIIVALLRKA
ncbi:MAG TPA: hypothetical protein VGE57_13815 [Solimonas sp.]